jgi:hypothetical protein
MRRERHLRDVRRWHDVQHVERILYLQCFVVPEWLLCWQHVFAVCAAVGHAVWGWAGLLFVRRHAGVRQDEWTMRLHAGILSDRVLQWDGVRAAR